MFEVNDKMCSSCIFGPNSPISQRRFDEIKQEWVQQDIVQECHQATAQGLKVGCRGHYEAARRSEIPHPIIGICRRLGLSDLRIEQAMGFFESIGMVKFVKVKDDKDNDQPSA